MTGGPELPNFQGGRILITGGLGFIGSNLALTCVSLGGTVTIIDCLDPNSGGNPYNIAPIRHQVRVIHGNMLDLATLAEHVAANDIVFNCAASTSHAFSMREPWADLEVNARGTINLLEAIRRWNPTVRLIHVGTTTQLGRLRYRPADEDHPEFPTDIYSADKCVSEKYCLIYAQAYGIRAVVMRLSNVFGPRAAINNRELTFNNYFIGCALKDEEITLYGEGRQLRNLVYVDDVVSSLVLAAHATDLDGGVFFVAADDHHSVLEVAAKIVEVFGTGRVVRVPWPEGRIATEVGDAVISNARLKAALGWRPTYDLVTGLRRTKVYYESCLGEYVGPAKRDPPVSTGGRMGAGVDEAGRE